MIRIKDQKQKILFYPWSFLSPKRRLPLDQSRAGYFKKNFCVLIEKSNSLSSGISFHLRRLNLSAFGFFCIVSEVSPHIGITVTDRILKPWAAWKSIKLDYKTISLISSTNLCLAGRYLKIVYLKTYNYFRKKPVRISKNYLTASWGELTSFHIEWIKILEGIIFRKQISKGWFSQFTSTQVCIPITSFVVSVKALASFILLFFLSWMDSKIANRANPTARRKYSRKIPFKWRRVQ